MKTLSIHSLLFILLTAGFTGARAQSIEDAEVPGDHFSLEGALELFKKSESPQAFEKMLNSSDSRVNNLDLNNDGNIDYIRVIDRNDGNVHAFILQAVISDNESQDVAVIELEKLADGKAVLQITGDADVYGVETIIEPTDEVRVNAGTSTVRNVVNVWTWPSVQYVYAPSYVVWVSPWSWVYHPIWWRPWRPVAYYVYRPYWRPYYSYYSVCHTHRIGYLPRIYRPYRTTSVIVHNHYHNQIDHYRSNHHDGRDHHDGRYSDNHNNGRSRSYDNNDRNHNNGGNHSRDNDRDRNNNNGGNRQRDSRSNISTINRSSLADRSRTDDNRSNLNTHRPESREPSTVKSIDRSSFDNNRPERSSDLNNNTRQTPTVERQRSISESRSTQDHTLHVPENRTRSAEHINTERNRSEVSHSVQSGNHNTLHNSGAGSHQQPARSVDRPSLSSGRGDHNGKGDSRRGRD